MLRRKQFFIREHVGMLKLSDTYDILDPVSGAHLGIAKEKPGFLILILRFLISKLLLPTTVMVYQGDNPQDEANLVLSIRRGFTFLRSKVRVFDREGKLLGWFASKLFSIGGAFYVYNAAGEQVAMVKGDWKGWNFRYLDSTEREIGSITKKWAGIGKELFTSADNYLIDLVEEPTPEKTALLLAAGLAVDIIYKER